MGISEMTSIQQAAIPHVLARKDTLVKSQTGSGYHGNLFTLNIDRIIAINQFLASFWK